MSNVIERAEACLSGDVAVSTYELIRDLLAIVSRLPVDAEGNPVLPGDEVWHPESVSDAPLLVYVAEDGTGGVGACWVTVPTSIESGCWMRSFDAPVSDCYPTREAAEAAREASK